MIKPLVEHLVKELVEKPEAVKVEVFHEDHRVVVQVAVNQDDFKRVIGKEGRVIKSIRSLVHLYTPAEKEVVVDVVS
jgi:predicted RNA-binding protein YlqC (UPF0109 family)